VAYANKNNEYVLHRAARLKKFIESNLFLNTDTRKDGVILEQILFALAAGLAMVFATSVAFVSQMIYGNLTLPFFIALIISYMFKDRIKELVRIYLNKKQHKFVQDYKTNIYDQQSEKIGYLKESFGFVKHKHIPAAILTARNSMRVTEITNRTLGEKIILHRNRVKIFSRKVKSLQDFSGTTEILRINISDFTKNMDDPKKDVFVKTKKGFKRGSAKRSYHLNMILNYSDQDEERIKLYKLIVNRNGIQRIEKFKFDNREK
jgi:rRNA processing protein Gar1